MPLGSTEKMTWGAPYTTTLCKPNISFSIGSCQVFFINPQSIATSRSRKASCGGEFGTTLQDSFCNHGDAKLFQPGIVRWDGFIEAKVVDGSEHCCDVVMGYGANEIERIVEQFIEVVLALGSMRG